MPASLCQAIIYLSLAEKIEQLIWLVIVVQKVQKNAVGFLSACLSPSVLGLETVLFRLAIGGSM